MKRFYAAVGLYDHGCKLLRYICSLISFLSVWENVCVCIRMNSKMEFSPPPQYIFSTSDYMVLIQMQPDELIPRTLHNLLSDAQPPLSSHITNKSNMDYSMVGIDLL